MISAMEKFQTRDFFLPEEDRKGELGFGKRGGGRILKISIFPRIPGLPSFLVYGWGGGGEGNGGFPASLYRRKPNIDKWGGGGEETVEG